MNPSPADDTIGSPSIPDCEEEVLSPLHREDTEDFEILDACFDSGASRSASSLTSASTHRSHSRGSSDSSGTSSQHSGHKHHQNAQLDVVEPLHPDQVRWFYKEDGDRKWTPFIGYDSLRIECAYQEITQTQSQSPRDSETDSAASGSGTAGSTAEGPRVSVRGGLYEADAANRKCNPIYWNISGEPAIMMRGTWFVDYTWQPIEEMYAEDIETEHLFLYQTEKSDTEKDKPSNTVTHTLRLKDFSVEWESVDKVYLHSEATSSKFYRAVGNKLGLGRGTRLRRTYCSDATMDDRPADISHLVFVIHGIGQKMDTGSIAKSCSDLRETCSKVMKYFPDLESENKRAEFLPVEWRSHLKLDGDTVESVTPNKVRGLRTLLNASAMDILYYTSPLYRSEITHGLQKELNRLYTMFCERNPYFEPGGGKISVVAHSLGVVIVYDILMAWNPVQLYDQYVTSVLQEESEKREASALVSELESARNRVHQLEAELRKIVHKNSTPSLNFRLENLFCLGSPLAVFLALRGVRPEGSGTQDHMLPRRLCSRIFNIYHPSDPIAYRLEPLILKHYSTLAPMQIHRHDQLDKPRYEDIPAEAMPAADRPSPERAADQKEEPIVNGHDNRKDLVKEVSVDEVPIEPKGRLSGVWSLWSRKSQTEDLSQELTTLKRDKDVEDDKEEEEEEEEESEYDTDTEDGIDAAAAEELFSDAVEQYEQYEQEHPVEPVIEHSVVDNEPLIDQTELEYRVDYQLREGKMESAYLATLTAHTAYWINLDVGVFMLSQLFHKTGSPS